MNKITTLTAVSMVALLLLSAMPASAIKEVSSFESRGPIMVEPNNTTVNLFNASELPMFYLDLDSTQFNVSDGKGESLTLNFTDNLTLKDKTGIIYNSTSWLDDNGRKNIAWLGNKYLAVGGDVTKLSKYLVDFESDEKITIKQGDVWDLGEGFTITVQDIDINGEQVWLSMEQDGSPVADIISKGDAYGYYNTTVAGQSDVIVAQIHVEKVFAGMTANMAIIDDAQIISMDVTELSADKYFGLEFSHGANTLTLTETDGKTSLSRGKTTELIKDFISIRVGDTKAPAEVRMYVYQEITEPGIYEQHGRILIDPMNISAFDANQLPMFYLDLDSTQFDVSDGKGESLSLDFETNLTLKDETGIIYTSTAWKDDNGRKNIAWLGDKYLAVGDDVTKLSKYLVDFESDEKITIKQGDVWDIGEGFTITVQDIDINGKQVWLSMEQDGSPVADIISEGAAYGYYNTTVAGQTDVIVAQIHVEKVFAGMTANMAIIDDAQIISMDVTELSADKYFGLEFSHGANTLTLTETDGKTSLSRGKTTELIKDFISIRVGDTKAPAEVRMYVYNAVQVGEPGPGPKPTGNATVNATVDVNATVAPTTGQTAGPTEPGKPTVNVTEKPKKEPGFEAVFAIAGLLAVAYLVLRKRE